jgi:hypothetical protein
MKDRLTRLSSPAWVLKLGNGELGAMFEEAYEEAGIRWNELSKAQKASRGDNWIEPNIGRRLDVLYDEITKREHVGAWTEHDWMARK